MIKNKKGVLKLKSSPKQKKYNFNFKVKIVQKDLNAIDYASDFSNIMSGFFGGFQSEDPVVYQNSSYISKLNFINSFSGGILKKDKIEDMPDRYRRFVESDNPSEAQLIKDLQKELIMLSNREEVGQNVFYSRLSGSGVSAGPSAGAYEAAYSFDNDNPESFVLLDKIDETHEGDYEESGDYEEYENYEDYEDNEEIKDILHLNSYFDSEMYKMSKVEYDFSSQGDINFTEDGIIEIKYDESEITGIEGSYIQLLFKPEDKNMLTIRRKNFYDMWFSLEKGKRISIDETMAGNGRFEGMIYTAHTKELVNNMTLDGGEMSIVYATETNGVPSEMIFHTIQAERIEK